VNSMTDLTQKKCVPCEGRGIKPYSKEEAEKLLREALNQSKHGSGQVSGWQLNTSNEYLQITKQYKFDDFVQAMKFVNQVADLAEQEGHHPNIHIKYAEVWLELYTHAVGGLTENDFIVAAKVNELIRK